MFDASQYAFFGNDVVEEVELGGLEDEEDELPVIEEDFVFDKEEVFSKPPSPFESVREICGVFLSPAGT